MAKAINWTQRTEAALAWVRQSFDATGGYGSSHSYHPVWGWAKAYPETTGYLIPTLLRYAELKQDQTLAHLAEKSMDWLLTLQLPDGGFPGGVVGNRRPSIFNTAMILFGMSFLVEKILAEEKKIALIKSLQSGTNWMLEQLESDGAWRKAAYQPGYIPSYYTYAIWGLLRVNQILKIPELPEALRPALHFYALRFRKDDSVMQWGLKPGPWAFTHTVAYTLQGFLESAVLLNEKEVLDQTIHSIDLLLKEHQRTGRLAGRYSKNWKGDYSFSCPVGNAQLSVLLNRAAAILGSDEIRKSAFVFLKEAAEYQKLGRNPNIHGALPGSAPFWGPYLRFRYPNWAVKFFLDAVADCNLFKQRSGL